MSSTTRLFVGGLPWAADDAALSTAFQSFGTVTDAKVILDRETGKSRGFGFVTFSTAEEAKAAIAGMDGNEIGGRRVTVREAQDKGPPSRGGGPGGPRRDGPPRPPREWTPRPEGAGPGGPPRPDFRGPPAAPAADRGRGRGDREREREGDFRGGGGKKKGRGGGGGGGRRGGGDGFGYGDDW